MSIRVGVIGAGMRAYDFARYARKNTDRIHIAAVCDIDGERAREFAAHTGVADEHVHTDIRGLGAEKLDAAIIMVPDAFHREVAEECLAMGLHVLLEKPMALTGDDCRAIIKAQTRSGTVLQMGFVLRAIRFYQQVKKILEQGTLGQVLSMSAAEHLSLDHSASFMRRWHRKRANSGSFLLTKCSHDIDMLNWLADSRPAAVASFGGLDVFTHDKQPATHCSVCPAAVKAACPYVFKGAFVHLTAEDTHDPSRNNWDLCVYNDDKDIVDNQVAIIEYENRIRATFSLQLFAKRDQRHLTITGEKGHLHGTLESGKIVISPAGPGEEVTIDATAGPGGHSGGDTASFDAFLDAVRLRAKPIADVRSGLESTVAVNAIDRAMLTGKVVRISRHEYRLD